MEIVDMWKSGGGSQEHNIASSHAKDCFFGARMTEDILRAVHSETLSTDEK